MGNAACWSSPQLSHHSDDSTTLTDVASTDSLHQKEAPPLVHRSCAPEHQASHPAAAPTIRVFDALQQTVAIAADTDSTKTTAAPELRLRHVGLDGPIGVGGSSQQRRPSLEAPPQPLMLFAQFGCEQQSTATHPADGSPTLRARDAERSFSVLSRSSPSVTFAEVVFIARGDAKVTGPLADECPASVSLSASQRPCSATNDLQRPDAFDDDTVNPIACVARRFSSQTATSFSSVSASDVQPASPTTGPEGRVDTVSLDDHCAEGMRYALPIGMRRPRNTPALRRSTTESRICTSVPVVLLGSSSGRQSRAKGRSASRDSNNK